MTSDYSNPLKPGNHTTHGKRNTPVYKVWANMIQRCENPNIATYHHYGGRDIRVCERWHQFENFYADMGNPPFKGAMIERKDNNGNYCPENCKWATRLEQANNRRGNRFLTFQDRTQTLANWSRELHMNYRTLLFRSKNLGWPDEKTLTTPIRVRKPNPI